MGALLTIFKSDEQRHKVNFFLDFQDYQEPTGDEEKEVYNAVTDVFFKIRVVIY